MKAMVLLAQTDTTVGFLSRDASRLAEIKKRPPNKPFLKVYADLASAKADGIRVPAHHKNRVRRSRKTTFVVKDQAFRIVHGGEHYHLIKRYGWCYSTSANESGHGYDPDFCTAHADMIVEDRRGLYEAPPSTILKLAETTARRLR